MKKSNGYRLMIASGILAMLVLFVIGYGVVGSNPGTRLGVTIPEHDPVVKLASVLENPSAYSHKPVVIKGRVAGQCAALCEFYFQDGVHSVPIYPQGFKLPRLQRGRGVTIYTQVIPGEGQVVFSALGLEMD